MNGNPHAPRAVPYRLFVAVWAGLLALTALTVAVARLRLLGGASVPGSLAIASAKAALVLFFFMHLRHEPRFLKGMLLVAVSALAIILMLTFTDVWYRR